MIHLKSIVLIESITVMTFPSSAQFQQQPSSAGLRLALLSVLDHPSNHPPRDSSITWSGVGIYHSALNESCSMYYLMTCCLYHLQLPWTSSQIFQSTPQ